jgi:hypothetical protein
VVRPIDRRLGAVVTRFIAVVRGVQPVGGRRHPIIGSRDARARGHLEQVDEVGAIGGRQLTVLARLAAVLSSGLEDCVGAAFVSVLRPRDGSQLATLGVLVTNVSLGVPGGSGDDQWFDIVTVEVEGRFMSVGDRVSAVRHLVAERRRVIPLGGFGISSVSGVSALVASGRGKVVLAVLGHSRYSLEKVLRFVPP